MMKENNIGQESTHNLTLLQHLSELRVRIIYSLIAVLVFTIVAFAYSDSLLSVLTAYFQNIFENLIGTGPADAFILRLKTAAFCGVIISSPYIFYQLWQFIKPGLYESERRLALPFSFCCTVCLVLGIAFCFFLVLPFAFQFFLGEYQAINVLPQIRVNELFSFIFSVCLVFGVIFEMPVLAFLLARLGIINHKLLERFFRPAVVVIFILAAVLTPPDVVTQLLLAIPLVVLYAISILIVKISYRKRD